MKQIWKIVGIILIALLLIFVVYKISTRKEKPFSKIEFNKSHLVFNQTDVQYLDTIVHAGLQCLNVDSAIVVIRPFKEVTAPDDIEFKAYLVGKEYTYILYINKFNREFNITAISHELIHLTQYKSKQLIINGAVCIWNGDTVDVAKILYDQRPWEKDAFTKQIELSNKVTKLLYK